MQCVSCAKTSIHCPLHPWANSDASILQNENSAPSALGEHPVTDNAEHGQQVAAQASCCCSGQQGCSGTKPMGAAAILDPSVSLFLTHRKERTLKTGTWFHPIWIISFSHGGKHAKCYVSQLIESLDWRGARNAGGDDLGTCEGPANTASAHESSVWTSNRSGFLVTEKGEPPIDSFEPWDLLAPFCCVEVTGHVFQSHSKIICI